MNVYDFDGTIYSGDSTVDFYLFSLRRHPRLWATPIPNAVHTLQFKLGGIDRQEFKQRYFQLLLPKIDVEVTLRAFWATRRTAIKRWYLAQRSPGDLVISASPEFLLRPICDELGVALLVTRVNALTGTFEGPNLRGTEKVRAFRSRYPSAPVERFYTDDQADLPLARLAERAYLVRGDRVRPWVLPDSP